MAMRSKLANSLFLARMQAKERIRAETIQQQQMLEAQRRARHAESLNETNMFLQQENLAETRRRQDRDFALQLALGEAQAAARAGKAKPEYSNTTTQAFADLGFGQGESERMVSDEAAMAKAEAARQKHARAMALAAEKDRLEEDMIIAQAGADTRDVAREMGVSESARLSEMDPLEAQAARRRIAAEKAKRVPKTVVNIDRSPASKSTVNDMQRRMFGAMRMQANFADLRNIAVEMGGFEKLLSKPWKAIASIEAAKESVGIKSLDSMFNAVRDTVAELAETEGRRPTDPEYKAFLDQYTRFHGRVKRLFNEYRRYVTGAAASYKEMEVLKESFLNGDMSPTEFLASLSDLEAESKLDMQIAAEILREGFGVEDPEKLSMEDKKRYNEIVESRMESDMADYRAKVRKELGDSWQLVPPEDLEKMARDLRMEELGGSE